MSLWIRLISVFLLLDIALFAVTAVATMIYAERTAADMAALIEGSIILPGDSAEIRTGSGVRIVQLDRNPEGWHPPGFIRPVFPDSTKRAARKYEFAEEVTQAHWRHIEHLTFRIEDIYNGFPYAVVVELEPVLRFAKALMLTLLIVQIYAAIRSFRSSGRIIHRTLRPIVELAERAQSIDTDRGLSLLRRCRLLQAS